MLAANFHENNGIWQCILVSGRALRVLINRYLDQVDTLKKPNTYRKHQAVLDRFALPLIFPNAWNFQVTTGASLEMGSTTWLSSA